MDNMFDSSSKLYHERHNSMIWEWATGLGVREGQTVTCLSTFLGKKEARLQKLLTDPRFFGLTVDVERRGLFSWAPPRGGWLASFDSRVPNISLQELNIIAAEMLQVATAHGVAFLGVAILDW